MHNLPRVRHRLLRAALQQAKPDDRGHAGPAPPGGGGGGGGGVAHGASFELAYVSIPTLIMAQLNTGQRQCTCQCALSHASGVRARRSTKHFLHTLNTFTPTQWIVCRWARRATSWPLDGVRAKRADQGVFLLRTYQVMYL